MSTKELMSEGKRNIWYGANTLGSLIKETTIPYVANISNLVAPVLGIASRFVKDQKWKSVMQGAALAYTAIDGVSGAIGLDSIPGAIETSIDAITAYALTKDLQDTTNQKGIIEPVKTAFSNAKNVYSETKNRF